jgi:hypothetical protein
MFVVADDKQDGEVVVVTVEKTKWRRRCKRDGESFKANIQTISSILLKHASRQSPAFF